MRTLIINLVLLITISCTAQNVSVPQDYEARQNLMELGSMDGTGSVKTFDNRYEGTKGTPYVFETWLPGEVFLKSKKKVLVKKSKK